MTNLDREAATGRGHRTRCRIAVATVELIAELGREPPPGRLRLAALGPRGRNELAGTREARVWAYHEAFIHETMPASTTGVEHATRNE